MGSEKLIHRDATPGSRSSRIGFRISHLVQSQRASNSVVEGEGGGDCSAASTGGIGISAELVEGRCQDLSSRVWPDRMHSERRMSSPT